MLKEHTHIRSVYAESDLPCRYFPPCRVKALVYENNLYTQVSTILEHFEFFTSSNHFYRFND